MGSSLQSHTPSRLRLPAWQLAFEAALRAPDTNSLFKLVEIAEAAILVRRDQLNGKSRYSAEQRAIAAAFHRLSAIKKNKLRFCL